MWCGQKFLKQFSVLLKADIKYFYIITDSIIPSGYKTRQNKFSKLKVENILGLKISGNKNKVKKNVKQKIVWCYFTWWYNGLPIRLTRSKAADRLIKWRTSGTDSSMIKCNKTNFYKVDRNFLTDDLYSRENEILL